MQEIAEKLQKRLKIAGNGHNFVLDWDIDFNFVLLDYKTHLKKLSAIAENGRKLLKTTEICRKGPEIVQTAITLYWIEILTLIFFVRFQNLPQKIRSCWKLQKMAWNHQKLLEIIENGHNLRLRYWVLYIIF